MAAIRHAARPARLWPALAALCLAACGSAADAELPPAAEPDRSPVAGQAPAGNALARGVGVDLLAAPGGGLVVHARAGADRVIVRSLGGGPARSVRLPAAAAALAADGRGGVLVGGASGEVTRISPRLLATGRGRTEPLGAGPAEPTQVAAAGERALVLARSSSQLALVGASAAATATTTALEPLGLATLRGGRLAIAVAGRARTAELFALEGAGAPRLVERVAAGVGPTQAACAPQGPCFVVDTAGDALLVLRVAGDGRGLRVSRRVFLAGSPYAIAVDPVRARLWITLTARNEVVELGAHGRPHVLRRLPAPGQPGSVAVDAETGAVVIGGQAGGELWRYPAG